MLFILFLNLIWLMPVVYALQETKGLSFENCVQHGTLIAPRETARHFSQLPGDGEIHKKIIREALLSHLNEIPDGFSVRTILRGHTKRVTTIAFSQDGNFIASGSDDRRVIVWNFTSGELLHTLVGHTDMITTVVFSPDSKILASASLDMHVKLWDPASGQQIHTLSGHTNNTWAVAFSPDGKSLASGSWDSNIRLWDPVSGKLLRILDANDSVSKVAFSRDGKRLFFASAHAGDNNIRMLDLASGVVLQTLPFNECNHIFAASNETTIWYDDETFRPCTDNAIRLWTDYKKILVPYFATLKGEKSYDQLLLALMVAQAKEENKPLYITELVEKINEQSGQSTTSIREWREILELMPRDVHTAFRKLFDLRVQHETKRASLISSMTSRKKLKYK